MGRHRRLVVGSNDGAHVLDLETRRVSVVGRGSPGPPVPAIWPRFGPDGVYYSAQVDGAWAIRVAALAGSTGARDVIRGDAFPRDDHMPDWSPDGGAFVFTADWESRSTFRLRIADAGATSFGTLDIEGVTPVWAPDGSRIAYQELGTVGVVAPDGSGRREWSLGWEKGVGWSPDGAMLIGRRGGGVEILDLEHGTVVPLAGPGSVSAVAWRPDPDGARRVNRTPWEAPHEAGGPPRSVSGPSGCAPPVGGQSSSGLS